MTAPHDPYNVPLGRAGIVTSPQRRQHAGQPLNLLTTSLGNARNASLGIGGSTQTPVSTTSLSTPFSGYSQSPYPQSPGAAMRGSSPMVLHSQSSFSGTYNPQQWGTVSNGSPASSFTAGPRSSQLSRTVGLAPRPVGPDEPVASPPPPYSPRRNEDLQISPRLNEIISPADTTSPDTEASRYGTPVSAATTLSPDLVSRCPSGTSPVHIQQVTPGEPSNFIRAPSFPPPPPIQESGRRTRSSSKNQADRLLSSLTLKGKGNVVSNVNAINTLQQNTIYPLARPSEGVSSDGSSRAPAPAARRAASTGGIGLAGSSRSNSHSPSPTTWESGMPLPPPPPGPPPAGARSQSLNRPEQSPSTGLTTTPSLPFRQRRPPGNGTSLEPVPPTPADWREEGTPGSLLVASPRSNSRGPSPLHIDTSTISYKRRSGADYPQTTTGASPAHHRRDSSVGGLFRSPAVRNRSAKGIRERRSESRNGKGRADQDSAVEPSSAIAPWHMDHEGVRPMDLVLPSPPSVGLKQRMVHKSTPKSAKSMQSLDEALNSAELKVTSGQAVSFASSHSTPLPASTFSQQFSASTSTPPFSPGNDALPGAGNRVYTSPSENPKSLLSPLQQRSGGPALSLIVPAGAGPRPISHLLHMPNRDDSMQVPLTPSTRATQEHIDDLLGPESPKAFAARANERHRIFAEREASAANDSERLDLFVQYMTAESRIRREQYASVFDEEGIAINDLTQGLFGHNGNDQNSVEGERNISRANTSKRTSIASSTFGESSSQGDVSAVSRMHESPSSATTNSSIHHRPESTWCKDYVPSLSPIASMSIVTGLDEMDSRGRAPSRWWEDQSHSADAGHGDSFNVLERSKRESKYMGVPKEARNLALTYEGGSSIPRAVELRRSVQPNLPPVYGHGEYPPEKVGWHEEDTSRPQPSYLPATPRSAPFTPDPRQLDISRLVTLPPPFPRHHPAVNNSHPDLADVRAVVRSLNEKEELDSIRATYISQIQGKRQRADSWCKHQQSLHQQDVEFRIEHSEITQEQYDDAEMDLEAKIRHSEKEITQADFDLFQESVLTPSHAILSDRVKLANISLDKLSSRLFSDAQLHSPNLPQEEGDEQPELLEKLTQLKWLFEVRESIHLQIYDLLSERNDKYKAIVLLPYQQTQNQEKRSEAELFFAQDVQDRRFSFEQAVHSRAQAFLSVIENNVSRGVEAQLSAFWDIAPSLVEVLHKIPSQLEGFEIQIPANEYEENPGYYEHPLQYLYSLLGHAEKSSYQFIESQTNLLCLLHEIRSHTLIARYRVEIQSSGMRAGEEAQRREERKLTEDLKEKVGVVEGQWEDALGGELMEARERVRGYLLEREGFEEEEV